MQVAFLINLLNRPTCRQVKHYSSLLTNGQWTICVMTTNAAAAAADCTVNAALIFASLRH